MRICEWRKVIGVFCILLYSMLPSIAGEKLLTTNSPFVVYMQNPPWIKEMQFKKGWSVEVGAAGKMRMSPPVTATFNASIQPSGFYFERHNPPPVPGFSIPNDPHPPAQGLTPPYNPDERGMGGISKDYFWTIYWGGSSTGAERDLNLDPRRLEEGGLDKNETRSLLGLYFIDMENIRFFGLPELRPNSFELLEDNQFKAVTVKGELLNGKILSARDGKPLELAYNVDTEPKGSSHSIRYLYGDNQPLPNYFEVGQALNGRAFGAPQISSIDRMELGLDDKIQGGYSPSMFFPDLGKFNHVIVWSNGVDYTLKPNGGMIANNHMQLPPVFPNSKLERPKLARMVMLTIIFGSAVVAWAVMRRTKGRET